LLPRKVREFLEVHRAKKVINRSDGHCSFVHFDAL